MRRSINQHQTSRDALIQERIVCALGLLPRDQIVTGPVNQERRCMVIAAYDLSTGTDGNNVLQIGLRKSFPVLRLRARGFLLAGKTTDDDGQGLRLPVDVKDDAAAGIGAYASIR